MTTPNPMLAELDAVVPVAWICDAPDDGVRTAVVAKALADMCERNGWKITPLYDHATLADMAKRMEMEAGFLKVAETTLYQIATTPRNAGARRNASATMRFIETQRATAIDATQEGEG